MLAAVIVPIPNNLAAFFIRPYDYDGPFCQPGCAFCTPIAQVTLHCFYRSLVLGHLDRPADHVNATALKPIAIIGIAPEFRWAKVTFAASPAWKLMVRNFGEETP
jgi:hypothetical protein